MRHTNLQPQGILEVQLTQMLADCSWRLNCARTYKLTCSRSEPKSRPKLQVAAPHTAASPATRYDATQDGFVIANEKIQIYIHRQDRPTPHQAEIEKVGGCGSPYLI